MPNFDGFMSGYRQCKKCGRIQKMYPDFESQWTHVQADGIEFYVCPRCWGIPDPAPRYCKHHKHDWEGLVCARCGARKGDNG